MNFCLRKKRRFSSLADKRQYKRSTYRAVDICGRENRCREGGAFLTDVSEIRRTRAVRPYDILTVKSV